MNWKIAFCFVLSGSLFYWGCIPPSNEAPTEVSINLEDPVFQKIHDFQDRQFQDSLFPYFHHENPTYRYLAAMAFGSIRDSTANDSLALLLSDPSDEVRAAAAFSIGQAGAVSGELLLLEAFSRKDTIGRYWLANRAILEAIGKCGTEENLRALSTISTYRPVDTMLVEGQALGIYRYALRGLTLPEGTARMLGMATDNHFPADCRTIAANYLYRAPDIQVDSSEASALAAVIDKEEDPRIRMALVVALGKARTEGALADLVRIFAQEKDYRVQCNILRALGNFDYDKGKPTALKALRSNNIQLAKRATQFFLENGDAGDATLYWQLAKDTLPWQAQLGMYQAANRHLPAYYVDYRDAINAELRQRLRGANSPYEKKAVLMALSEFGWNYRYIYREGFQAEAPAIRTATLEALAAISGREDFRAFFGAGYRQVRRELLGMFLESMQTGDPAMIAIAAEALRNEDQNYKAYIQDFGRLDSALVRLELPKEIEAYNELRKTLAFFKDEPEPQAKTPDFNHPIDWTLLNQSTGNQTATIKTPRGNIAIELLPEVAPGTVVNFLALARQGFYTDKAFHRVVPNFVIQGGGLRGDGYGSLDYTIRSELSSLHYLREGYVGMASSGNHTECTQFFITHSPTLHLDGNYTIFGRVASGMDIVHQIQIGDRIEEIALK
ncbi:MAG: peptidylprolyl isomerase [Lewinellaceae bacterium]|nr:peptidylprolyl isomerase [Lewinellaceae bacterium]